MATILLVDDDVTTQIVLQDALEREGHEVKTADDGKAGLLAVQQLHPDVVICDWMMPEMDGLAVCEQIKANSELATIFFILLTARERVGDRVRGLDSGADDFLSKPIETEELLARVRAGLRVQNLTRTLSQTNHRLKQTVSQLKKTQAQLIQSEKMSSLGQLVAGIAHEINNPVSFIHSNIEPLQVYVTDLIELLDLYRQEVTEPSLQIREMWEAVEPEFIKEDASKILASMQSGSDRIRQVVLSLRNFSRLDEQGRKSADIHQCIESALSMLQHRWQPNGTPLIQIVKEYSELPLVDCYAREINQVFLQILENAIDVLISDSSDEKIALQSAIHIRTQLLKNERVSISIVDNGPGITDAMKDRIFDPFFTTKPVGKGRGLGLFVAYQIVVEQHGGRIACISQPEKGVEFKVELPVKLAFA